MSFLGDVIGAVAGGALAYFTGGASLAVGAAAGGAIGGAASGGGLKGAIGGAALGYGGGALLSGMGVGAAGAAGAAGGAGAVGAGSVMDLLGSPGMGTLDIGGVAMGGGAAAGVGSLPWGSMGNLMNAGTSIYGLYESQQLQQMAKQLQASADPFGPYRAQYAQQINALAANPSLITQQPGYAAGLQAVQRTGAAQGYTGSGNMALALQKYSGDFYNNTMSMYGGFAGANANPAAAASIGLQGYGLGANLAMNSAGLFGKTATMASGAGLPANYPAGTTITYGGG